MFARLRRTVMALAAVLTAYLIYALVAVPFIEPTVRLAEKKRRPFPARENQARRLEHLFPADAWELGRCKVLETDQGTLLFENYRPTEDSSLELTKCTVIGYVDSDSSEDGSGSGKQVRRPVIIRAPGGATLHFDEKLDPLRGEFGRLLGGQLNGEVRIYSPPTTPDSDDRLELVTRNVQVGQQKIWTPHQVQFRYGPNHGSGRGLTILLANSARAESAEAGLGVSGIRSLEMDQLERMELLLQNQGLFGKQPGVAGSRPVASGSQSPATPVQVECQGPVRFDIDRQLISLDDQVRLSRLHPGSAADQLLCQRLEIHFTGKFPRTKSEKGSTGKQTSSSLVPSRVVATGSPVTVRVGSLGMGAQADRLEYDCQQQRVWLHDSDKVLLHDRQRQMEAKELRYTLGEQNRLGELWAQGPGIVRGEFGDDPRQFTVTWRDKVHLQRIDGEPVLSFNEQAVVTVLNLGRFVGDTVHLYLREVPRPGEPGVFDTQPDRLHALGHVEVDSARCYATLREARVWFKPQATAATDGVAEPIPESSPANLFGDAAGEPTNVGSKFELRAHTVEAVVLMEKKPAVDLLIVRGDLELREQTAVEGPPLVIRGNHFELQRGASPHPQAALLGSPAEITARGMVAHGPRLHLYPLDNLAEIVGPGELRPADQSSGPPPATGLPFGIAWSGRMQFDGSLARFEQNVVVRGAQRSREGDRFQFVATGDAVTASLSERIDFQSPTTKNAQVQEVAFDGWGFLQTEGFDIGNERKLFQQMQVLGLSVNQISGDIRGTGPGWLRGVHRSQDMKADSPAGPAGLPLGTSPLTFLRIDFDRELVGNLHQQRLEFLNGTRTLYGPVQSWEESLDQEGISLPETAIRMTCDRLAVSQFGEGKGEAVELEAVGNTHIQGSRFTATGGRASYVRQKDQFVLEGDGRNDARIELHPQSEGRSSHLAAAKILYWPKTGQCKVDGLRPTEIYDLGNLRGRSAPPIKPR